MATARDYITSSLKEIGVLGEGESPTAEQAADGLEAINDIIDQYAAIRLQIYSITRSTWTIVSGTGTYTVGSGGDVNIARPVYIEKIHYQDTSTTPTTEYQMSPLTDDAWANLAQRDLTSLLPSVWYYNPSYPLGTLIFYPVPTSSTLEGVIYHPVAITELSSLDTTISVPPGYRRLFKKHLALDLCNPYDVSPPPGLAEEVEQGLSVVKTANFRMMDLSVDAGALCQDYGLWRRYSIITGT